MTGASEQLFRAISNLRKAIETDFTGNTYYLAAQQIIEMGELFHGAGNGYSAGSGSPAGFTAALTAVRSKAEAELFDNRFYIFAHKLDVLSFLAAQAGHPTKTDEPQKTLSPRSPQASADISRPVPPQNAYERNFEELAAASKARVQQSAAALGIEMVPPLPANEESGDGELRRRSSEDKHEAECANPAVDPMAATRISAKTVPPSAVAQISPDIGLSSAAVERDPSNRGSYARQAKKEGAPCSVYSAKTTDDRAALAAGKTVESANPRQSLFLRCTDMILGRGKKT